ncbi:MAG TPA: hypothetical protein VNI58_00750 [Mariprofundaceae bacterium]|nr:hypothetical protein [Mariprofundaceae bacterium]
MTLRWPHIRKLARLFAGAFAVQVIAAGACLMVPEAHAMPMQSKAAVMAHCTDMEMASDHAMPMQHGDKSACPHCDQPDSIAPAHIDFDHLPAMAAVLVAAPQLPVAAAAEPVFAVRTPTGPPRSASLIYQTTQRIRI